MGSIKSLDVKAVIFFRKLLNYYINKRVTKKELPEEEKVWQSLFTNNTSFVSMLDHNIKINLYKESKLCKLIYSGFEQTEIEFLKAFLKPGDVFFDVGSNIGLFSLFASPKIGAEGQILAFEPTPETFERLLDNIALNNFNNINALNIGLSNKTGTLDLYTSSGGYDAWNSMVLQDKLQKNNKIKVPVQTLNDILKENNISKIDLIKIDVEGWEKYVIEGAHEILKPNDAPVLLVEFTETTAFEAGYYLGELYDLVKHFGYNWYSYNPEQKEFVPELKKLHYPWENLIAIKNLDQAISRINTL